MLADVLAFVASLSLAEFFFLFWYFFLFEFTRYVLLDGIMICSYLTGRLFRRKKYSFARSMLFSERPLVSIIAPGRNEGKNLHRLVATLREQTYQHFEVIIVDDGSDDNTAEICSKLQQRGAIDKFLRNSRRGGKASAANLALRYSEGRFIIHMDADSHLRRDAIEGILTPFYMNENIAAVGGDIRVANINQNICTSLQALEYMKALSTGRTVASMFGILRIISGAYGAFRGDVLRRIKGWDPGPGLDGDLTLKIRKLGYKVVHAPHSACYTNVPASFRKLSTQRYRWERSLVRFRFRKHKDLLSFRNKNFSMTNTLTVIDNILYNFIFNIKWWVYIIQILIFYKHILLFVITINLLLYTVSNTIQFFLACLLYGQTLRRSELLKMVYIPLMPPYTGWYLRLVRTYAHIMELLFSASYQDPWNPWKVSRIAKKADM
jgi:cellulose synthase/poly-beta-1,6-N-acetylglucosamine synthase-like glycosyltransferase